jgi:NodT family efflux transporter outer membrane factor (OMF) lipoprotein
MTLHVALLLLLPIAGGDALPERFAGAVPGARSEQPWWRQLGDARLTELVEESLTASFDLAVARDRVLQLEAIARQSRAALLPSVSIDVATSGTPGAVNPCLLGGFSAAAVGAARPSVCYSGSAMLVASLQADIWGRAWTGFRAALLDAAASRDDRDGQAAALAAAVAQTYLDAVTARAQLEIAQRQLEVNEKFLTLIEARFEQGAATALDVLQQRQQVAAGSAALPRARAAVRVARQQLAVLLGRSPSGDLPAVGSTLPDVGDAPPTGTPAGLLEARPDLRAVRSRTVASEQRAKSTFRAMLPSLRVSGQIGYQGNYAQELDTLDTWSVGAALTLPLFEGGRAWAAYEQAEAARSAAVNSGWQATLDAIQQVESALVRDSEQRKHLDAIQVQHEAARLAFEEARARYLNGIDNYLNVLTALGIYQAAQLQLLQARHDAAVSRVQTYHALGGSWTLGLASATRATE